MQEQNYSMIFKRKSFHKFTGKLHLSQTQLEEIENFLASLQPLVPDIKTVFRLVPREQTTCRIGEYSILIYSEEKENYLQNAGYMGQQLDLWLASKNIGACWYGMAKAKEQSFEGLGFVIMLAIEKVEETEFRGDYTKAKRKPIEEMWEGEEYSEIESVVRYAPSACNSQPWLVRAEGNTLQLYRVKGKKGIIPQIRIDYYNAIDIGIFMLILETCLTHHSYTFSRELPPPPKEKTKETLTAVYTLEEKS